MEKGIRKNHFDKANLSNLRRNIHRIEKGLSYPVPKEVFAEDYILETVLILKTAIDLNCLDTSTKNWGKNVLNLYFKNCFHSPSIEEAYAVYKSIISLSQTDIEPDMVPYLSRDRPLSNIDYETFYQLAIRRRSVRYFLDKTVDKNLVKKAMDIALLSPSACNRQSFKYLYFDKPEIVSELASIPGGVQGYTLPAVIVVLGCYGGYFDVRDVNVPIIDASLTIMSFILALETLGLSSVCINWPNIPQKEEKVRQIIKIEEDEFIILMIGLGYPDLYGKIPYSAKLPTEAVLFINQRLNELNRQ
ncbi:nitroreductase family protein [Synechococcus elongatus IITB4]|uniref:nitroreductase family protein n=1 Tax=Synechococcus elongatus TaxID=32046 RepID=UPI0030D1E0C7